MKEKMTDWESIKEKYLSTDISCRELADECKINRGTLSARASREKWSELRRKRKEGNKDSRMERVTEKLLQKMEEVLDRSSDMDSKEIKTMTGALKELRDLQRQDDGEESGGGKKLEVCFLGDTEELSR